MSFQLNPKQVWQIDKAPAAVLDYSINWTALHGDETGITSSVWSVDEGDVTVVDSDVTGFTTSVLLSGGELGQTYTVRNRITTVTAKQDERIFRLRIAERSR